MTTEHDKPIILFDGVCNLCQSSVQFVIRHDRRARFRFAALQSDIAQQLLEELEYEGDSLSSIVLVSDGQCFRKSRAALRIARQLDGVWPMIYFLFFWIPPFISDVVYDFVGNRRYRWFGKKEECWIPDESLQSRFLSDTTRGAD